MDGKAASMPEELLHEREFTRTGVAPVGSRLALEEMAGAADSARDEEAAVGRPGLDAELRRLGAQNGHACNGALVRALASHFASNTSCLKASTGCMNSAYDSYRGPFASAGAKRWREQGREQAQAAGPPLRSGQGHDSSVPAAQSGLQPHVLQCRHAPGKGTSHLGILHALHTSSRKMPV